MKIRRILIAVDASPHSLAALEAAAAMAALHKAELVGLFVEDINLIRLAQLPFARELLFPATLGRQIDSMMMEHSLRDLAEKARQAMSESASRMGVQWTFHIRRGSVLDELLAAASEADLLAIGKASQERTGRVRLGAIAANLIARAPHPVLVLQHGEYCRGPALLVCHSGPDCLSKLPQAVEDARIFGGEPTVLLLTESREEAVALKRKLEEELGIQGLHFRRCSPNEPRGIARICHEEEAGLVMLVGLPDPATAETLPAFLEKVNCPVLACR